MAVQQNYVLGRGKLYFDQFQGELRVGRGERYLGNTPSLSITQAVTKLDHYSSDEGIKLKDASVDLQNDSTATFSTDNIDSDNLALWFAGDSTKVAQLAGGGPISETRTVLGDRFYQLGASPATPLGSQNVSGVVVKNGAATVPNDGLSYTVDLSSGRLYIVPGGSLAEGVEITVSYSLSASNYVTTIERGAQAVGALRFISSNPTGIQRDYYFPYVKISSDGDYALKGDDWQTMNFTVDLLLLDNLTRRIYIQSR